MDAQYRDSGIYNKATVFLRFKITEHLPSNNNPIFP